LRLKIGSLHFAQDLRVRASASLFELIEEIACGSLFPASERSGYPTESVIVATVAMRRACARQDILHRRNRSFQALR
jgi:hypothetical protein